MKIFLYLLFLTTIFSKNTLAWTLVSSGRTGFQTTTTVDIYIGTDTCSNAHLTPSSLQTLVQDAVDQFWNTVPSTSLKLEVKGLSSTSFSTLTLGQAETAAGTNKILIGCNSNASIFGTSVSILGVGGMSCTGTDCRGAIVMNDISGSYVGLADHQTVVAALAHEMGHALGLGHTSEKNALMYYDLSGKTMKALHQDDINGITYLYPNSKSIGGLGGACGSVAFIDKNDKNGPSSGNFLMNLLMGFLAIFMLLKLNPSHYLKKPQI